MARVLLLLPTTTYRTKAFMDAALDLGLDIVAAAERRNTLTNQNPAGLLTLDLYDPERAARDVAAFAAHHPIDAVIPVDDDTAVAAAHIAEALRLRQNPVAAAEAAKNKHLSRQRMAAAGLPVPRFWHFTLDQDAAEIARRVTYPCVVKPVFLSTSRGVMRADDETQFVAAVRRLEAILWLPNIARRGGAAARDVLVEEFIPGFEVAVEGLLTEGRLRVLAIFDKPDPLDGPFFEETIYVTPSRLAPDVQRQIAETTQAAARALGLISGPIHAELRVNRHGPWVIEVAARAIGGLCSRTLRFGGLSLEEVILRHAIRPDDEPPERESLAAGVMMIPIPRAGILREVRHLEEARAVPNVEEITISVPISREVAPPPEGASYLGFIFSRAATPEAVEAALREAHRRLEFVIEAPASQ